MRRPSFNHWKWDKQKHKVLAGTYVGQVPNLGKHHSTLFFIEKAGKRWAFWGTLGIKRELQWMEIGRFVRIEYKGEVRQKNGYVVKNFRITTPKKEKQRKAARAEGSTLARRSRGKKKLSRGS